MRETLKLPIEPALPRLQSTLAEHRNVVLQAPPGAGKTTIVPLALVDQTWLANQAIVMLEPRRLATRAAAYRMSELLGESIGQRVGYRMRLETRVSSRTRIEVVTEGILTRRIQSDPTLAGVGLLIFDEFHERSLNADLGLALALRTQELVREDLRLLVMSATLDGDAVARLLGGAPIVTSEGRAHAVATRYRERRPGQRMEAMVAATVIEALQHDNGDILVFLPGAREIRRVESLLAERELGPNVVIAPLFGMLPRAAQDLAIRPSAAGRRKVVLSTSIAETSLTIEGVHIVIDAGLSRMPRFSARSGMTRLETVRVSRASADQRRGRAGRLGPGVCYRLWPEHDQARLLPQSPPEILGADLAPLALDLLAAGVDDPTELRWLDPPPAAAFGHARELLQELSAIDAAGVFTAHGKRMAEFPVHPRLSHMLLRGRDMGLGSLACEIAALLGDRDILRAEESLSDADINSRIGPIRGDTSDQPLSRGVDRDGLRRARAEADRLARILGVALEPPQPMDRAGVLLALAYPDRVGQRRPGESPRYVLRNGRGAIFSTAQSIARSPFVVAAELDDQRPESRIFIAAPVDLEEIREQFRDQIVEERVVEWHDELGRVVAQDRERLGALILREAAAAYVEPVEVRRAVLGALARAGIAALPWSPSATRLRQRIAFLAALHPGHWPDVSDKALSEALDDWLAPQLMRAHRTQELSDVDLEAALLGMLTWEQRRSLDQLAPTHLDVPSGSRIAIDYSEPTSPVLAVRIQEVFGLTETPRIGGGRVPLTMHLLSPAQRPVQVTKDLASFWRTSYFDVRKDLRGRYPKHEWPENPLAAVPTRRTKRRG